MQVDIEDVSPVEKRLAVRIEWPVLAAKLEAAYREAGRDVAIKGFRKGKAPRAMLERMFAGRVEREVRQKLMEESVERAVEEHGIEAVADARFEVGAEPLKAGQSFAFAARVEVRAPFVPKGYFGLDVERPKVHITDEHVQAALEAWRRNRSAVAPLEGRDVLRQGDLVLVNLTGAIGERGAKRDDVRMEVGVAADEAVPGLAQALVGAAATGVPEVSFAVTDSGGPEWLEFVGQPVRLAVELREVKERRLPSLDDEFVRSTGDAESVEALREKLRARLPVEAEQAADAAVRNALVRALLEKNPFEVAPSLVEARLDILLGPASGNEAARTKARDELRLQATDDLRAWFLFEAIAAAQGIVVSDADVEERLVELAAAQKKSVLRLRAELQQAGTLDQVRLDLREKNAFELLISRATVHSAE